MEKPDFRIPGSNPGIIQAAYERLARECQDSSVRVGRRPDAEKAENLAFIDIVEKLQIQPSVSVLSIGCGCGQFAQSWLNITKTSDLRLTLNDFPDVLDRVWLNYASINGFESDFYTPLVGDFCALSENRQLSKFDRIEAYSVLHLVENPREFISKAVDLLAPGGRLLIGDLPNLDKRARRLLSAEGRSFEASYFGIPVGAFPVLATTAEYKAFIRKQWPEAGYFDDLFLCSIVESYRSLGFDAYLLPQPENLPFGRTREDLLIIDHS